MGNTAVPSGYRRQPFILHDSARQFHWSGVGSASIKTFTGGTATYRLERGTARIQTGQFLLLNDDQPYEITIDAPQDVESFCVFFPTGMAQRIVGEMTMTDRARLDDPDGEGHQADWTFLDRVYAPDIRIVTRLAHLRQNLPRYHSDTLWVEQQACLLMGELIGLHSSIVTAMRRIPAVRKGTREELLRRVLIAHEWIHAHYREDLTLTGLARVATLSPNHLIRSYRQIFGVTPHQHVTELRLREAAHLLQNSDLSVLAICSEVGFTSPSTFSGTFRRKTGRSPLQYRQAKQPGDFEEDSTLTLIYTGLKEGNTWNR